VPSTDTRSRSEPSDEALNIRSGTPERTQRRNRLDTLFQFPDRSGRSRHGDPVRNRQSTASGRRRLSAAGPPGSDFLPAGMSPIRAHILSAGTVPAAFMMSPACSARAAVPAVTGTENGMETDGPQPECQRALVGLGIGRALRRHVHFGNMGNLGSLMRQIDIGEGVGEPAPHGCILAEPFQRGLERFRQSDKPASR